jgi:hypothetical protein
MKKGFLFLCTILFFISCQVVESQTINEDLKKDQDFQNLLKKVEETKQQTIITQTKASEKESKIVNKTVEKIVTLKEEVRDLKIEINEKDKKLNGIINDTGIKYNLLPISNN